MGSQDFEACPCCGKSSRRVWGRASREGCGEAVYFVHWTLGEVRKHGARFTLILGRWGEGATRDDRFSVALELRWTEQGPQFMVRDAEAGGAHLDELVGRRLRRDEVIGTPLARQVFDWVDWIWLGDPRIAEVTGPE
jgi:hypothetical protein